MRGKRCKTARLPLQISLSCSPIGSLLLSRRISTLGEAAQRAQKPHARVTVGTEAAPVSWLLWQGRGTQLQKQVVSVAPLCSQLLSGRLGCWNLACRPPMKGGPS